MPALRLVLVSLAVVARAIGAQDSTAAAATPPVAMPVELLTTAETERLVCRRQHSVEQQAIQRRGAGWYTPAWEGLFPISWVVDLADSRRQVTLGIEANRRPRELVAIGPRAAELGGGLESVRVRFLADGSVHNGHRAIRPGADAIARAVVQSALLPEDGVLGHTLARELAYRCERGLTEPLVPGWIWSQIPPS
jgi:hypothetical protein